MAPNKRRRVDADEVHVEDVASTSIVRRLRSREKQQLTDSTTPAVIVKPPANKKKTCPKAEPQEKRLKVSEAVHEQSDSDDSNSESDWEEVEERAVDSSDSEREPVIPKEGVEITLDAKNGSSKSKKKPVSLIDCLRRKIQRFQKEVQEAKHKVHLLALLARGFYVNNIVNEDTIRALALSLVPEKFVKVKVSNPQFTKVLSWCCGTFLIGDGNNIEKLSIERVCNCFEEGRVGSNFEFVVVVASILRTLGIATRFVFSLQPVPIKPTPAAGPATVPMKCSKSDTKCKENSTPEKKVSTKNSCKNLEELKCKSPKVSEKQPKIVQKTKAIESLKTPPRRCSSKKINYKDKSDEDSDDQQFRGKEKETNESGSGDDFCVQEVKLKKQSSPKGLRNSSTIQSNSLDRKESTDVAKMDEWLEVYNESKQQWVCVDCINNRIDEPNKIENLTTKPICYVVAFDKDSYIKDVTKRYAAEWMTDTRKLRVNQEWWEDTLKPYRSPATLKEMKEDSLLDSTLALQPHPTRISDFKNHPLYALGRHILKFEALYPEDTKAVGVIRGESIYPRHCVRTLHSRETWLKQARQVTMGEVPYKMVKARPKWNKVAGAVETPEPLELFGEWQTEEYIPPLAVDGKVPRNGYGNVDLFKPCMLPRGTVHLKLEGLNRVARKLNIDCARAMIGFDIHSGVTHPVFDGWIVCEEAKDMLLDAWNEEQAIIEKREEEKREKRVYGNWKRIIKGLLIRERLNLKYGLQCETSASSNTSPSTMATTKSK